MTHVSPETRAKIKRLHQEGLTVKVLSERFGIDARTIHRIVGKKRPKTIRQPVAGVVVEALAHRRSHQLGACAACPEPSWFAVSVGQGDPIVLCRSCGYDLKQQLERSIAQAERKRSAFNPVVSSATVQRFGSD